MDDDRQGTLNLWIGRLANCLMITMLWLLCCIPIITVGASTASAYNAAHLSLCHQREGVWSSFTSTFKKTFKKATKCWLVLLLLLLFFFADYCVCYILLCLDNPLGGLYYFCGFAMAFVVAWEVVLSAYLARFPKDKKKLLRNSLKLTVARLPQVLLLALIVFVLYLLFQMQQIRALVIMLGPGLFFVAAEKLLEPALYKLMTDEEKEEEREAQKKEEDDNKVILY